jgi:hypothetical protein
VRKVLTVTLLTAVATALLSCAALQPSVVNEPQAPPMTYEPLAPVVHAPLAPPVGYASTPPRTINSPPPLASDDNSAYGRSEPPTEANMVWHASPRWAAIMGNDRTVIEQDPQAKFKAAQAKTAKVGLENLSEEDLDGLDLAQLKELRGY